MRSYYLFSFVFVSCVAFILQSCSGCTEQEDHKVEIKEDVKELDLAKQAVENIDTESEPGDNKEADSLKAVQKKLIEEKINENPLREKSCEEFLETIESAISDYKNGGDVYKLHGTFKEVENYVLFRECLKTRAQDTTYINRWYRLEGEVRQIFANQ